MSDSQQSSEHSPKDPKEYEYKPEVLRILLKDRTTGHNIKWATGDYKASKNKDPQDAILLRDVRHIKPHASKSKENKRQRTQDKAEVFTAAWICNLQNNLIDTEWFGREHVFNKPRDKAQHPEKEYDPVKKIIFGKTQGKTWKDYVKAKRLEITCGEAPYLVSRYDTTNGEPIEIANRIGFLDRKLRVVSQEIDKQTVWYEWTRLAFQSVYGYEYQGDSLFLARKNLLDTFCDYYVHQFKRIPSLTKQKEIADIISWNIWQMNGLEHNKRTYTVPFSSRDPHDPHGEDVYAKIFDWDIREAFEFRWLIPEEFLKIVKERITEEHGGSLKTDHYLPSLMRDAQGLYEKTRKPTPVETQLNLFQLQDSPRKQYLVTLNSIDNGRLVVTKSKLGSKKHFDTILFMGALDNEQDADNLIAYLETNFVHYLVSSQTPQESNRSLEDSFKLVPIQNFKEPWDDHKLCEKYGLGNKGKELMKQFMNSKRPLPQDKRSSS